MNRLRFCLVCRDEDLREAPMRGVCARCLGPACLVHDRCFGCEHLICRACDARPTPAFAFPGAICAPHPHNDEENPPDLERRE